MFAETMIEQSKKAAQKERLLAEQERQLAVSTYGTCLYRLKNILEEAGIASLLVTKGNTKYIDTRSQQLDCDLYQMLNGEKEVIAAYAGTYLRRYSWAEERAAQLNLIKKTSEDPGRP